MRQNYRERFQGIPANQLDPLEAEAAALIVPDYRPIGENIQPPHRTREAQR